MGAKGGLDKSGPRSGHGCHVLFALLFLLSCVAFSPVASSPLIPRLKIPTRPPQPTLPSAGTTLPVNPSGSTTPRGTAAPAAPVPTPTVPRKRVPKPPATPVDRTGPEYTTKPPDTFFEKQAVYQFDAGEMPMDMAIAPDGRVFFAVLDGRVLCFIPSNGSTVEVHKFGVFKDFENGLLGLAVDPDFSLNNYLYVYWSPPNGPPQNVLSRFTVLPNNTLSMSSETRFLSVRTQRLACCHQAGDLKFDSEGYLLVSIGDNSMVTNYTTTDERSPVTDSQKSASNTNDFRGKILRIKPHENGTYSVHPNNLFPPGLNGTRPEIFAMGLRNPFRFTVDPFTNNVYVGDVGPDAHIDDPGFGPKGYDEVHFFENKKGGNGGWPYCIGNNSAYIIVDWSKEKSTLQPYDCKRLRNPSKLNTGLLEIPPADPAMIWYSYGMSKDFPTLSSSDEQIGRTSMTPVFFRYDETDPAPYKMPKYFDQSVLFMDWSRNYLRLLKVADNGTLLDIVPIWDSFNWKSPIDAEVAPDGSLYVLEFGDGWKLTGALMSRVHYVGPTAANVTCYPSANPYAGQAPMTVYFSSGASYNEGRGNVSALTYAWDFDGDGVVDSTEANPPFLFRDGGSRVPSVVISAGPGLNKTCTAPINLYDAGNTKPIATLESPLEGSVFTWGQPVTFLASVTDAEDGSTRDGTINCTALTVSITLGHNNNHNHPVGSYQACSGSFIPMTEGGYERFQINVQIQYEDRGGSNGARPIKYSLVTALKPSRWEAEHFDGGKNVAPFVNPTDDPAGGGSMVNALNDGDWLMYEDWNLFGMQTVSFRAASRLGTGTVELRMGSPTGRLLATTPIRSKDRVWDNFIAPVGDTNQWYQVDMGVPTRVGSFMMDVGQYQLGRLLRGWSIYSSADGKVFGDAVARGTLEERLANSTQFANLTVTPPVTARFWRIVNTAKVDGYYWTITELTAYDPAGVKIPSRTWTASASVTSNQVGDPKTKQTEPSSGIDGDPITFWTTGESQRTGVVDLYIVAKGAGVIPLEKDIFDLNDFTFQGVTAGNLTSASNSTAA